MSSSSAGRGGAAATAGDQPTAGRAGGGGAGGARANGGAQSMGGTGATAAMSGAGGRQGRSGAGGMGGGPAAAGVGGASGAGGSGCPSTGHVSYSLAKSASPTATEQAAYGLITTAMDKAIGYYNCYTNITKSVSVSYVASVQTADGNINGSLRFGSNTSFMDYRTAMHEISHTVGIGQASSWSSLVVGGRFIGSQAVQQLQAINATLAMPVDTVLHADSQHFWPYGINQQSEVKSEADLIAHCQMVVAIRQDLGLQ